MVIFLSDDHGFEFSGCYGSPDVLTPRQLYFQALDSIRANAVNEVNDFPLRVNCLNLRWAEIEISS